MVVKFFGNKKGGSSKAIDYLLNEREAQGTAKVLQGDPQLTKDLINSITHKQKVTVGCLAFEETNISEEQKYKLMEDFEKHLLPGMQDRYNILWVEHTDKDNLELNFVIPKIDLESQKSLNPYYHKADLPRVEKWQDLTNLTYSYSNPKDPSKRRTLETNPKEIRLSQDYEQLDKLLHNLVQDGKINNRSQLMETLEENNIEITRKNKDGLSIKLPDSKRAKRFKGAIYNEQFTSIGELREVSNTTREEIKQYNSRDTQQEIRQLREDLISYTQDKSRKLSSKYETRQNDNNSIDNNSINSIDNNSLSSISKPIKKREHNQKRWDNLHRTRPKQSNERQEILSVKGLEYENSIRATINDRIRARENDKYGTDREYSKTEDQLLNSIRQSRISTNEELTKGNGELYERARKLREEQQDIITRTQDINRTNAREIFTRFGIEAEPSNLPKLFFTPDI